MRNSTYDAYFASLENAVCRTTWFSLRTFVLSNWALLPISHTNTSLLSFPSVIKYSVIRGNKISLKDLPTATSLQLKSIENLIHHFVQFSITNLLISAALSFTLQVSFIKTRTQQAYLSVGVRWPPPETYFVIGCFGEEQVPPELDAVHVMRVHEIMESTFLHNQRLP